MTDEQKLKRVIKAMDELTLEQAVKKQSRRGSKDPLQAIVDRKRQDARQEAARRLRETF